MASTTSKPTEKLIFAPTDSPTSKTASQYLKGTLHRSQLSPSPITQFHSWYAAARASGVYQPETVCLSTASLPSGRVSSRYVYLKELSAAGDFVIYSNFGTSNKSKDLEGNKFVSLAFWWHEVERQVRVEGKAERMSREESQVYYNTRGRASKIGAWASEQSRVLEPSRGKEERSNGEEDDGRSVLDARIKAVEERFNDTKDEDIPVPDFWGGLKVVPDRIEFWQGRDSRLHDRFIYARKNEASGEWSLDRLSP